MTEDQTQQGNQSKIRTVSTFQPHDVGPKQPQSDDSQLSLPIGSTERVLALIAEALQPEHTIWPLIVHDNSEESHVHNGRMRQLWIERGNEVSPGICICNVTDPACSNSDFFAHGNPCREHALTWYHFFHCVRARTEDYRVVMQQLGWCECQACLYYARKFDNSVDGVAGRDPYADPFKRRSVTGPNAPSVRQWCQQADSAKQH